MALTEQQMKIAKTALNGASSKQKQESKASGLTKKQREIAEIAVEQVVTNKSDHNLSMLALNSGRDLNRKSTKPAAAPSIGAAALDDAKEKTGASVKPVAKTKKNQPKANPYKTYNQPAAAGDGNFKQSTKEYSDKRMQNEALKVIGGNQGKNYAELKAAAEAEQGDDYMSQYRRQILDAMAKQNRTRADIENEIAQTQAEIKVAEAAWEKVADEVVSSKGDEAAYYSAANRVDDLMQKKAALESELWMYDRQQKYSAILSQADYETEKESKAAAKDDKYVFINDINGARGTMLARGALGGGGNYAPYTYMTADEIGIYNYLYNTSGKKAANEYLDYLEIALNERSQEAVYEAAYKQAKKNAAAKAALSVASIPLNLGSGAGYLDVMGQKAQRLISGDTKPIDYNRGAQTGYNLAQGAREGAMEGMSNTGKFIYSTAMSMGDSLGVLGLSLLTGGSGATLLLGGSAATSTMHDAKENGANDGQALAMGLIAGAAETLMERLPLEKLLNMKSASGMKEIITQIAKQGGNEATEEALTTLANTAADALIMGDKSELRRKYEEYVKLGYTQDEAERKAKQEWAAGLLADALGGFISGGVFGLGGTVVNNLQERKRTKEIGAGISTSQYTLQTLIEHVEKGYTDSEGDMAQYSRETQDAAERIKKDLDEGKKVSDAQKGKLANLVIRDNANFEAKDLPQILTEVQRKEDAAAKEKGAAEAAELPQEDANAKVSTQGVDDTKNAAQLTAEQQNEVNGSVVANEQREEVDRGTERAEENTIPSDGRQGRFSDAYTGDGKAIGNAYGDARTAANRAQTASDRQNKVANLRIMPTSAEEIGIKNGGTTPMYMIPAEAYDDELLAIEEAAKNDGLKIHYFTGAMTVGEGNALAVIDGNDVYVKADSARYTAAELYDHEKFHKIFRNKPQMIKALAEWIKKNYDEAAFDEIVSVYYEKYNAVYGLDNMPVDDAVAIVVEEILADAYAGTNKFRAGADLYTDAARSAAEATGKVKPNEYNTNQGRGPPQNMTYDDVKNAVREVMAEVMGADRSLQTKENAIEDKTDEVIEINQDTTSAAPTRLSLATWNRSEYVTAREKAAEKLSKKLNVDIETAYKYIDDINSVAALIADDRVRLDYEPNLAEDATVLKPNSEYKYTVDMSTLCAKRLVFTGTFDAIQKELPNTVFTSEDIVELREMMQSRGYEVACGICYVESTRREIGRITQEFIDRYKIAQETGKPITRINSSGEEVVLKTKSKVFYADAEYTPNLGDLNTTDIDVVKKEHRDVYDAYLAFMNARGQAKPKLLETRAEYKGEILKHFKTKSAVEARNAAGGLRLQSYSDFEVPHLIDMMQIITDMSVVGLKSQAYTKVPAFAEAFGDTGVKINLSLIAAGNGLDENGNLIFDDVEGINHEEAFRIRGQFSENVGTILVGKNDEHIIAAMADPRIDYIIPFHKSSWKESLYDALGLTGYDDYTDTQNEKPWDEDRKIKNFDPSEYWDFTKSGDENAQIYLAKCEADRRTPKFPQFIGYDGYWKLLIDFKMYNNEGVGAPQRVVRPIFSEETNIRILNSYKGGHRTLPVAKDVVKDFVEKHKEKARYSLNDENADPFYSYMAKVVDEIKQEKLGANSVVNMLRGKGVKAEEIKWSGIEEFLEGKKSVTKAELREFVASSMLQIEEEILDDKELPYTDEQKIKLEEYTANHEMVMNDLIAAWERIVGLEAPFTRDAAITGDDIDRKLNDAAIMKTENTNEAAKVSELRREVVEMIVANDNFGYDRTSQALRTINWNPENFVKNFDVSPEDAELISEYVEAKRAAERVRSEAVISEQDKQKLKDIAEEAAKWSRKIVELRSEHRAEEAQRTTNWRQYKLEEGENYREILFKLPGSDYHNDAMGSHWNARTGVLAHARVQDFDTPDGKMLFIEEIQSDWHNEGHKTGYIDKSAAKLHAELDKRKDKTAVERTSLYRTLLPELIEFYREHGLDTPEKAAETQLELSLSNRNDAVMIQAYNTAYAYPKTIQANLDRYFALEQEENELAKQMRKAFYGVPDAPFRNTYHEYVLKRLIREAAENGYDSIGWTTANIQSERWSEEYAEGYRIEYDQDIPKFLNKYGKKWGAKVERTHLGNTGLNPDDVVSQEAEILMALEFAEENAKNTDFNTTDIDEFLANQRAIARLKNELEKLKGTEIWSMKITDSMRESVMREGQPMYSLSDEYDTAYEIADIESYEDLTEESRAELGAAVDTIDEIEQYRLAENAERIAAELDEENELVKRRTLEYAEEANNIFDALNQQELDNFETRMNEMYDKAFVNPDISGAEDTSNEHWESIKAYITETKRRQLRENKASEIERENAFMPDGVSDEEILAAQEKYRQQIAAQKAADEKRYEGLTPDEAEAAKEAEARIERQIYLEGAEKKNFMGSEALKKLGIKISRSIADYKISANLIERAKANDKLVKEMTKAIRKMHPSSEELWFARGIVDNDLTENSIPMHLDPERIMEIADYMRSKEAGRTDLFAAQKADINNRNRELASEKFKNAEKAKRISLIKLNYLTPRRAMMEMFGKTQGEEIFRTFFAPVRENDAERIRWTEKLKNDALKIKGADGKEGELSKEERAVTQMLMEGKAAAEMVARMTTGGKERVEEAARKILKGEKLRDETATVNADDIGTELTAEEERAAKQYAVHLQALEALKNSEFDGEKIDTVRVNNAAEHFTKQYDMMYEAINEFLVAHGEQPIGFIKGYAPHIQADEALKPLESLFSWMNAPTDISDLRADIAGETHNRKPNKKWNPHFLSRGYSSETEYDVYKGFDEYVEYISEVFYHMDDIMRLRAASRYLRTMYTTEDSKELISQINKIRDGSYYDKMNFLLANKRIAKGQTFIGAEVDEALDKFVDDILNEAENKEAVSGNLVMWLDNYTNLIAGKQNAMDRGLEQQAGRNGIKALNKVINRLISAQVVGNVSSALNQMAQLPMTLTELGGRNVGMAIYDLVTNSKEMRRWATENDFLVARKGTTILNYQISDKVTNGLAKPLEISDYLMATITARAAYRQAIMKGMSVDQANAYSVQKAEDIMGSRNKATKPVAFSTKRPLLRLVNAYQIEVLNQWQHIIRDLPAEYKTIAKSRGKSAAAARIAKDIVLYLVLAALINRLAEKTYGGTPAPLDLMGIVGNFIASGNGFTLNEGMVRVINAIVGEEFLKEDKTFDAAREEEFNTTAAIEDTLYTLSGEVPFLNNVLAVMGLSDDKTVFAAGFADAKESFFGKNKEGGAIDHFFVTRKEREAGEQEKAEVLDGLYDLAMGVSEFIMGGRQLQKTIQGIKTMAGHGTTDNKGNLMYPVENTVGNWVKAVLFGKNALEKTQAYYASGASPLKSTRNEQYYAMVENGVDEDEAYRIVYDLAGIESDKDKNGKTISGSLLMKQMEYIMNLETSDEVKSKLAMSIASDAAQKRYDDRNLESAGISPSEFMLGWAFYQSSTGKDRMGQTRTFLKQQNVSSGDIEKIIKALEKEKS